MKVAKFVAVEDIALRKFPFLLTLIDDVFEALDLNNGFRFFGERYNNDYGLNEFINSISILTRERILLKLRSSPFYGISCDESTDVSGSKSLIIYAIFTDEETCERITTFLGLVELTELDAAALEIALLKYLLGLKMDLSKIIGVATDGGNVMIGHKSGLTTRLKHRFERDFITIHCAAHRLALACSNAAGNEKYLNTFDKTLQSLYCHYKVSFINMMALKLQHQQLGNDPHSMPELKRFIKTRWMSRSNVVSSVYANLEAIITNLQASYIENPSDFTKGLLDQIRTVEFVGFLCFLKDLMDDLAKILLLFQEQDLMIWDLDSSIENFLLRLRLEYLGKDIIGNNTLSSFFDEIRYMNPGDLMSISVSIYGQRRKKMTLIASSSRTAVSFSTSSKNCFLPWMCTNVFGS